jgi:hypothetical protein
MGLVERTVDEMSHGNKKFFPTLESLKDRQGDQDIGLGGFEPLV